MVAVGHDVFDIKHYWLRYEFAPSRGQQIHSHLLAICGDHSFNVAMHRLKGNKVGSTGKVSSGMVKEGLQLHS
jgi:hypothetical protein